eukprot:CAMPEP_0181230460 /NCGR_PEP_ID=MMETSP1096-20121128/34486_1 /TAXON_ID=156174 ORGANISM="Chrysochromulina ericina, Strain CCMP281" /NCGR_SAMPLE_ID=MMETSP1096 /ASSEMBLY_ACC=CAM_ASM_000453 /LENGTH=157 /DNA_ID=CAMNT_0023324239 /DNA_START=244 /DNA_END=713 /DNA_ORIENTATION=-
MTLPQQGKPAYPLEGRYCTCLHKGERPFPFDLPPGFTQSWVLPHPASLHKGADIAVVSQAVGCSRLAASCFKPNPCTISELIAFVVWIPKWIAGLATEWRREGLGGAVQPQREVGGGEGFLNVQLGKMAELPERQDGKRLLDLCAEFFDSQVDERSV